MDYDELLKLKLKHDEIRWRQRFIWSYKSYKKYRRMSQFKISIPEWDKKIKEEHKQIMAEFKLRKQYSKNYQVVELEVEGSLDQYDQLADWLDDKLRVEVNNIPRELLVKDNAGSKKPNYYERKEVTPKQYTNNQNAYNQGASSPNAFGKPFGSPKQWSIIEKNQKRLLDEQGLTPAEIQSAEQLKEVVGLLFQR